MVILPIYSKFDWRQPPLMTLLLVIINCAVFWGPQRDDDAALNEAVAYYFESDLGAIEIPLYEQFLQDRKPAYHSILHSDPELRPMIPPAAILLEIYSHEDFITDLPDVLRNSLDPPQLEIWWRHHDQVKKILSRVTWFNYGMRPAYTGPTEMLTHMFLHGGIGHLLGNMLFLMLVGYVVEMILGKTIYLFSYLAAGVVAGGFDLVFNSGSIVTGIGASGAISGVMGMYVVLFGLRKINFFYHVLFYFNYIKLPAIVVLPVWIGYELLKMVIYPDSNVNYLAHAGGLIGGAILGFVGKSKIGCADSAVLDSQKTADDQKQQHHAISQLLSNMEYEKAALLILRQESWHRFPNMLSQLTAASNNINNKLVAQKVFLAVANLRTKDKTAISYKREIFNSYVEKHGSLPNEAMPSLFYLSAQFVYADFLEEAESLIQLLLATARRNQRMPELLYQLAKKYRDVGDMEGFMRYSQLLHEQYPGSALTRSLSIAS